MRAAWTILVTATAMVGCSGLPGPLGGGSSSSSSSGGGAQLSFGEYYRLVGGAYCQWEARCLAEPERQFANAEDCAAYYNFITVLYGVYGFANGVTADAAAAQMCVDGLASNACDSPLPAACSTGFVSEGGSEVGGPCGSGPSGEYISCHNGNAYCDGNGASACNQCRLRKADGQSCSTSDECLDTCVEGTCASVSQTSLGAQNASCSNSNDCRGALTCVGTPSTCQPAAQLGEPCSSDDDNFPDCRFPTVCAQPPSGQATCVATLPDGTACNPSTDICATFCLLPSPGATMGTCGVPQALPGAGQACLFPSGGCNVGLYGVVETGAMPSCTCQPTKPVGQACEGDNECTTDNCVSNTCTEVPQPGGPGAACDSQYDCASRTCIIDNAGSGYVCSADPTCAPPSCQGSPSNTTPATALVLTPGQSTHVELCVADAGLTTLYFRINGLSSGDALRVRNNSFGAGEGYFYTSLRAARVDAPDGFYEYCGGNHSDCAVFLPDTETSMFLRLEVTTSGAHAIATDIRVDVVSASANVCSNPPTNTSPQTATMLTDGQDTSARFCSASTDTEYYWRVPGSFSTGDLLRLEASPPDQQEVSLEVVSVGSFTSSVRHCSFPRASYETVCLAEFDDDTSEVYVVTDQNPSLLQDFMMTLRTTRTTDPGFTCANPPANQSLQTAMSLPLDQATTVRTCGAAADRDFWFRIPGPFAVDDMVLVDVSGDEYFSSTAYTWNATSMTESYVSGCYVDSGSGPRQCIVTVDENTPDLYLATNTNPSADPERSFAITPARTTDPHFSCANPPTNQSAATATTVTLGAASRGRFCSALGDREFWWRVPVTVNTTNTYRLQVDFVNGSNADDVDFRLMVMGSGGSLYNIASCYASSGQNEDCSGTSFTTGDALYVVTSSNPRTSAIEESFDLTVTVE